MLDDLYFANCEVAAGPSRIFSKSHLSVPHSLLQIFEACLPLGYLHGDLEDPEQPERPEDGQAEGARLGLEVRPDLLEGGEGDDEGVEAVEGGLHVDADAQRPHPQQHLEDEQPEEHEFGSVCGGRREIRAFSGPDIPSSPKFTLGIFLLMTSKKRAGGGVKLKKYPKFADK